MIVQKYGGSILADAEGLKRVAAQIQRSANGKDGKGQAVVAVVSALKGVTDQLLNAIDAALRDDVLDDYLEQIEAAHRAVIDTLPSEAKAPANELVERRLKRLRDWLAGVALIGQCPDSVRARIAISGELLSSQLLTAALQGAGCNARCLDPADLPVSDASYLDAVIDIEAAAERIKPPVEHEVLVVPGFIGSNRDGELVALGRNGTDYTAAAIAAALDAGQLVLWKDVDGLFSADPRAVPAAQLLPHVSYGEAMELSYFGTGAIAAKAIAPLASRSISCRIRNIDAPDHPGTVIGPSDPADSKSVKGVTLLDDVTLLPVEGPGMRGHIGMARRVMDAMAAQSISILLIVQSSSEYNITLCVRAKDAGRAQSALREEFALERQHGLIEEIEQLPERSVVTLVGDGMRHQRGIAARFLTAVSAAGANVEAIAQGSSECAIGVVLRRNEARPALRAVHDAFFGGVQKLDVILLGCGNVGAALLEQFRRQRDALASHNIEIRVRAIANSRVMLNGDQPIDLEQWSEQLAQHGQPYELSELSTIKRQHGLLNPTVIDCTSSQALSDHYVSFLADGFNVVAANKKANTGTQAYYRQLRQTAGHRLRKFLYETNVGAGLPVIDNLQGLLRSGDEVLRFQGILSGSLSALFGFVDDGMPFSEAVSKIVDLGYTEPHPRDDLSGMDVARKLLIIAREIGLEMELSDIEVEPVIAESFAPDSDKAALMAALPELDDAFAARVAACRENDEVLRYVAELRDGRCRVAITPVAKHEPLAAIRDGENALALYSRYYNPIPMVLRGYGAGAQVTAAGVFSDVLRTQWQPLDL